VNRGQENEYGIKGWIKEEMAERERKNEWRPPGLYGFRGREDE
jgi:hypothetical protein